MDYITKTHFPHHKLAAYAQALRVLVLAMGLCEQVPRGYAKFANQLMRAAGSAVFNTGEAANARMPGEKRNAFGIARKETAEPPRSRVRTRASTRRASRSTLDVRERWKGLDACSRGLRVSSTPRCPRPVHCRYACAFSTGCCR